MTKDEEIAALRRHLLAMTSTADDLLDRLINATEDFSEEEQVSQEEADETREAIDSARTFLHRAA